MAYTGPKSDFEEIGRLTTSNSTDVVLSKVLKEGELVGFSLNKYVTTSQYVGYSKGIFIPPEKVDDFLALIDLLKPAGLG